MLPFCQVPPCSHILVDLGRGYSNLLILVLNCFLSGIFEEQNMYVKYCYYRYPGELIMCLLFQFALSQILHILNFWRLYFCFKQWNIYPFLLSTILFLYFSLDQSLYFYLSFCDSMVDQSCMSYWEDTYTNHSHLHRQPFTHIWITITL